jgi:CTP synthase (UTP-ammonia lyase)
MNSIAVIGDFNAANASHLATDEAIRHCAAWRGLEVDHSWIGTEELGGPDAADRLAEFNGLWIGPGSPYRNMDGALLAIRTARERHIPLIGTCGGFQHIIIEYARNVLGIPNAEHEETSPHASHLFISRLACSLVGRTMNITLEPDSLIAKMYGRTTTTEQYLCSFGVNPECVELLRTSALRIVGSDEEGIVRAVELAGHPFFVGTLFIPQLSSRPESPHPLIAAFIKATRDQNLRGLLEGH